MERIGGARTDEAARRAADEAARLAAEAAARQAAGRPAPPLSAGVRLAGDDQGLGANTALEAQRGPRGEAAMPAGPQAPGADDFDGFEGFDAPSGPAPSTAVPPAAAKGPSAATAGAAPPTNDPSAATADALAYVEGALTRLSGTPEQAVGAAAELLGDPQPFAQAVRQLATLKGTPAGDRARALLDRLAAKVSPAFLAQRLGQVARPAALPAATLTHLARLRALPDAGLQAALDRAAPASEAGGVSGLIDKVSSGLGGVLKFAVDGVGKVARLAIDVTGQISTVGLDLTAAALDAVGAKGAAAQARKADALIEQAYGAVGEQVELFAEGVGSAFRDTVTGIGSTIAHPIETLKGIAHLVANPAELPKVAMALWDTATEKGAAYAIGYVAGNLLPMVLSGGSSSGGTLGTRLSAIAGESRLLTAASRSRVVVAAGKLAATQGELLAATRAGRIALKGYEAVATVAGKTRRFASVPRHFVGKLAANSQAVQKAVGFVKATAARLEASGAGRAVKRLARAYEDRVVALNDLVDGGLRKGLKRADDAVLGAEQAAASRAARAVSPAARVQRGARELTEADRKLLERHGTTLDEVEEMNRAGLGKNKDPQADTLIKAATPEQDEALRGLKDRAVDSNRRLYDQDPTANLAKVGANRVEDGMIFQGARPYGDMPSVRVNYNHPRLKTAMAEARAIAADATLSAEQRIAKITDLVRGTEGQPGLLRAAASSEQADAWFNAFNRRQAGAEFRLSQLDDYLDGGIGDCRHFAITNQTLLQELEQAVPGLNPRVVYTATYETVENGKALAVNHAFNVVTLGGEDIVVDAILPHFTGGKVRDYVEQGIFGREVRFVDDRFQTQAGRWIKGGENVGTAFNTRPVAPVVVGQVQAAQEDT